METLIVKTRPNSNVAYRVAGTEENPNPLKNEAHAAAILAAREAVKAREPKIEDFQALLLFDLYDKGMIFYPYHIALAGLCQALDPADELGKALHRLNPSENMNELERAFEAARYGINFDDPTKIGFTSHEGFLGVPTKNGSLKIEHFKIDEQLLNEDSPELVIADMLGLTHFTYQYELQWTPDSNNIPFPSLLSNNCRTALGVLGANGQFEYVRTV